MNHKSKTMYPNMSYAMSFLLILFALTGCKSGQEKEIRFETITDVDGNSYKTVEIGEQVWMAEDLKTKNFNDGSPIARVENYDEWASIELPAYSWYNNDSLSSEDYGLLYNGYAIDTEKLCPQGWHVPTDEDWIALESVFSGAENTGGALKQAGTSHWKTPNTAATNESGFTALPGGYRSYTGTFNLKRTFAYWWSSTEKNWFGSSTRLIFRAVQYEDRALYRDIAEKNNGFSVRCVKNP
jgi:uncharacterized protein (TIGR02145 family)